jgi:hypothetical protein
VLRRSDEGGPVTIVDRAYAAVTPSAGIMHFVAQYDSPSKRHYEEYWIDVSDPQRRRIVQSFGGRVTRQLVSPARLVPKKQVPLTEPPIVPAPPLDVNEVVAAGSDPVLIYRKLLHAATVLAQTEITYRGRPAYRLVVRYKPPYKLVGTVWTGERVTYIVDARTYFPLEFRWRGDPTLGGGVSVTRYPVFEILPHTARNQELLKPAKNPEPYHP